MTLPNGAVVHLRMDRGDHHLAVGSGVLYRREAQTYIVTAWHNVTGRHSENLSALSSKGAYPDRLTATVACRMFNQGYAGETRRQFDLPLDDSERTYYLVHPQGFPRVDVVAIPIDPSFPYPTKMELSDGRTVISEMPMALPPSGLSLGSEILCIQDYAGASAQYDIDFAKYLSVSDDLFILGYPKGIVDLYMQPLWKRATVATSPHIGWERQKKFLVDCASREGMSGAPVITFSKNGRLQVGGATYMGSGSATLLHGLYVGRVGSSNDFEAQIGTVWSREVIDEIIDAYTFGPVSGSIEATIVEMRTLVADNWPSSEGYADAVVNGGRPTGWFSFELAKKMNGRASFEELDRLVLEEARRRCGVGTG